MKMHFPLLGMLVAVGCGTAEGTIHDNDSESQLSVDQIETEWVTVPSGEFTYGSPYSQPCRGDISEEQVEVIITHPFKMAATEITRKQWRDAGFPDPSKAEDCDDCAQGWLNWYDAMAWLNAMSKAAGLEECYDLSECTGTVGAPCPDGEFYQYGCIRAQGSSEFLSEIFSCPGNVHKFPARVDCPGYRLPTVTEWEWAARGGTTTATYNGDLTTDSADCPEEPVMETIAWHCGNSERILHPVRLLEANAYGLYDMLGNAGEWVSDIYTGASLETNEGKTPPLTDPVGKLNEHETYNRPLRGGSVAEQSCRSAATTNLPFPAEGRGDQSSFRPVRTILE